MHSGGGGLEKYIKPSFFPSGGETKGGNTVEDYGGEGKTSVSTLLRCYPGQLRGEKRKE